METNKLGLQEYLSLGYIYLLIVGLITDSIFYSFFNINILNYSTFLDILITPINLLTSNFIIPIALAITMLGMYFANKYTIQKNIKKGKIIDKKQDTIRFVLAIAFLTIGFYSGLVLGKGEGMSSDLKKNTLNYNYHISFNNGKSANVKIIGQNSLYLFYVIEDTQEVIISLIANTIFQIKKLNNKKTK